MIRMTRRWAAVAAGVVLAIMMIVVLSQLNFGARSTSDQPAAPSAASSPSQAASEPASSAVDSADAVIPSNLQESQEGAYRTFVKDALRLTFDTDTGGLVSIANADMTLNMQQFMIDVGYDEQYAFHTLEYISFDPLPTWETPSIVPSGSFSKEWKFNGFRAAGDAVTTEIQAGTVSLRTTFTLIGSDVKISTTITNLKSAKALINGVAFRLNGVQTTEGVRFHFPGGVPYNMFGLSDLSPDRPVEAGIVTPIVHTIDGDRQFNTIFVDPDEKWSTGLYKDETGKLHYVYLAAVESELGAGESLSVGDLYIQANGKSDSYQAIRDLYARNGWLPPANGVKDGPVYATHPEGPFDKPFRFSESMDEFSQVLQPLHEIGIRNVWLLPIFAHGTESIYNTNDMSEIEPIYGDDAAVKQFVDTAHGMDMRVIFDYVPHGPEPFTSLAEEHKDWVSVQRDGSNQLEWDCFSFDMANPQYMAYIQSIVTDHVRRFGLDGARIDTAMGGLPNWKPYPGNRPSNSNLKGGVNVTRTIREGFVNSGVTPLVLPENFNPVPLYYPFTDLFYDMPLYRTLYDLNHAKLSDQEYAVELERWLNEEHLISPPGLNKLRFLGNHDTVSWVWDKARGTAIYGEDKAKAMWALMSFIDGVPMLYQGDEYPAGVGMEGPDLRAFFKEIFGAREQWLGSKYDIRYITTDSPIIAFERFNGEESRLVLVNLSPEKTTFPLASSNAKEIVFGNGLVKDESVEIDGYGYAILI